MVVQHNLRAMNSNRMLGLTQSQQAKSSEKLSSGYKINRAADDAAGLSISEKMRKQIRGLTQASLNAQDGISAVQTAEGALHEVQDMLQRMNELAVKAANGTMSEDDRGYIQDEIDQLITEIDRVSETTKFNETYMLKGSKAEGTKADINGVIAGEVKNAEFIEGKGNIYQNQIVENAPLATGTEDTAVIQFIDNDGNTQKVEVTFETGKDATATAQNLVDAINDDVTLSKVFKATVGVNGRFELESVADGSETSSDRNRLIAAGAITFKSADNTDAIQKTELATADGTAVAATAGSYSMDASDVVAPGDTGTIAIVDGDSITIDGKTFTYDTQAKVTVEGANTFATLKDLKTLLGDEYDVSVTLNGTLTETFYDAQDKVTNTVKSDYVHADMFDSTSEDPIADLEITAPDDDTFTGGGGAAQVIKTYSDMKMTLNVVRKAGAENAKNTLNFSLQVGADTTKENKISVDIQSMSARSLGINNVRVDGKDSKNADAAVDVIANAIQQVSTQRSALGAVQNRLEHTINNLDNVVENTTAAESQIRDTDMATEMVKFSNANILAQAGQAMLAQSNQANQGVLALLQ